MNIFRIINMQILPVLWILFGLLFIIIFPGSLFFSLKNLHVFFSLLFAGTVIVISMFSIYSLIFLITHKAQIQSLDAAIYVKSWIFIIAFLVLASIIAFFVLYGFIMR